MNAFIQKEYKSATIVSETHVTPFCVGTKTLKTSTFFRNA